MSNDSHAPAMTTRPTGRPKSADTPPIAQTTAEHAIHVQRAAILRNLPTGADIAYFAAALRDLGELHDRAARENRAFYTVHALMERYSLARKTVDRLPIPRHKIGNAVRFAASDVEAYELKRRQEDPANGNSP